MWDVIHQRRSCWVHVTSITLSANRFYVIFRKYSFLRRACSMLHVWHVALSGTFPGQNHFESRAVIQNPLSAQINNFRERAALTGYCPDLGRSRHDEQSIRYNQKPALQINSHQTNNLSLFLSLLLIVEPKRRVKRV